MVDVVKMEGFLRVCAIFVLLGSACLIRFDSQTKVIFAGFSKTASFRDLKALFVLVYIEIAAAAYNMVQLVMRSFVSSRLKPDEKGSYRHLSWVCFFFDQGVVYLVFAANSVGFTASLLAVTGLDSFYWMKLCNRYFRFCFQIGGALLCGYVACFLMALISFISAFNLFRQYSPKQFLVLKGKQ